MLVHVKKRGESKLASIGRWFQQRILFLCGYTKEYFLNYDFQEDGNDCCHCADTPVVGPPVRGRIIHDCAYVGLGVHIGDKRLHLCEQCGELVCGKVRVKWRRNILSVRCISLESASAILLSVPVMRRTEE